MYQFPQFYDYNYYIQNKVILFMNGTAETGPEKCVQNAKLKHFTWLITMY